MENIEKEKMDRFLWITNLFLEKLKILEINPILRHDGTIPNDEYGNSMSLSYSFKKGGLKYWYLGVWGCGGWSNTYDSKSEDYISVFLIHKWHYDKFRPSSADLEFRIDLNSSDIDEEIRQVVHDIIKLEENPVEEYYRIFSEEDEDHDLPCIEYFRDWWFYEVEFPFTKNLKFKWSVKFLYGILRAISIIDPRVNRGKLFYDEDCFAPWYTSGFLATEWASDCKWAFDSFAWLYAKLPRKLCRICGHRLFDAEWNVADFPGEITNTLEKRMWRGVVL